MKVIIPTAFRAQTGGAPHVSIVASTVGEALEKLVSMYPGLREFLFDDSACLASFVNVFVNDQNIRDLDQEATPLKESDELLLIPAIAGG